MIRKRKERGGKIHKFSARKEEKKEKRKGDKNKFSPGKRGKRRQGSI